MFFFGAGGQVGMNVELRNQIIRMAWEDRTTFEEIQKRTGFTEREVIQVMRGHLKLRSFRMWRKRVSGRPTKHGRRFRESCRAQKRLSGRSLLDQAELE